MTPFVAAGIGAYWVYWNSNNKKHNAEYVGNPKVGDVYTISESRNDGTAYYFLRVAEIKGAGAPSEAAGETGPPADVPPSTPGATLVTCFSWPGR